MVWVMDGDSADDGKGEFTWVGWEESEGEWIGCLDEVGGLKQEVDSRHKVEMSDL